MYEIAQNSLQQELITRGHVIVRRLAESHSYQVSLGLADELKPIIDKLMQEKGIFYVEFDDLDGKVIQTGDGQFKAQSEPPQRRPSEFYKFDPKSFDQRAQGVRIQGPNGDSSTIFLRQWKYLQMLMEFSRKERSVSFG